MVMLLWPSRSRPKGDQQPCSTAYGASRRCSVCELYRLGGPGAQDVFVTAADDIAGIGNSSELASRLTLLDDSSSRAGSPTSQASGSAERCQGHWAPPMLSRC